MKKFDKKVLWVFKLATEGHGKNVREALRAAIDHLKYQLDNDWNKSDLEAIENNEVVLIDEEDTEDDGPTYNRVPYNEFLNARRAQIEATKREAGDDPNVIIVDPEDEVVCDRCNALVETPELNVADDGSLLLCDDCLKEELSK